MEFYVKNNQWKERDSKDGKYWIITEKKTVVEIPDFFETKHVFKPPCECRERRTTFEYENGLIPSFKLTNRHTMYCLHSYRRHSYCCSPLTGKWSFCFRDARLECKNFTRTIGMLNKMDEETVERRARVRNIIVILPKELRSIVCEYVCT